MTYNDLPSALNQGYHQATFGQPLAVPYGTANEVRMAHENAYAFHLNRP